MKTRRLTHVASPRADCRQRSASPPAEARRRLRQALEEYCALDTLGMAQIVDQLKRLTA